MSQCNHEDLRETQNSCGKAGHDGTYIKSHMRDTVIGRSLGLAGQIARQPDPCVPGREKFCFKEIANGQRSGVFVLINRQPKVDDSRRRTQVVPLLSHACTHMCIPIPPHSHMHMHTYTK